MIKTISTDRFTMTYCVFGRGDKSFVILPGLSVKSVLESADDLERAYAPFAKEYTVYLFDRREDMPDYYPVEVMARDTAQAMEALGLQEVDLFGASQGGMMAQVIAIEYPHLVRKLVLGSTSSHVCLEQRRLVGEWIRLAQIGDRRGLYLDFAQKVYPAQVFEQIKDAMLQAADTVTEKELKRFVTQAAGAKAFDITEDLGKIRCPVFAIGAEDDHVLGAAATREIAERLQDHPGFERYMYDGYGHAAYDTAPDYKERMLRFLRA